MKKQTNKKNEKKKSKGGTKKTQPEIKKNEYPVGNNWGLSKGNGVGRKKERGRKKTEPKKKKTNSCSAVVKHGVPRANHQEK